MKRRHEPTDTFGMPDPGAPRGSGFGSAMRSFALGLAISVLVGGAVMGWIAWFQFFNRGCAW